MTQNEIKHVWGQNKKFTHGNPVVDHRPQKDDPNRIHITAGGNLVKYDSGLFVCTANLDMAKIHQKSFISTQGAIYMYLET